MTSKEQALAQALNTVYEALFGMSRDAMIAQAKQRADYGIGAGLLYSLEDEAEAMRDCLSIEALSLLNEAEGYLANYLSSFIMVSALDLDAALKTFNWVLREECLKIKARHGDVAVWYDSES